MTTAEGRRFGLTVGAAFAALGGVAAWRGHLSPARALAGLGLALVLAALLVPGRLGPVHRLWMGFAAALSRITTPVIMAVLYYVVIMPTGLLRRLGGNPVRRSRAAASFWVARDAAARSRRDMQHQF